MLFIAFPSAISAKKKYNVLFIQSYTDHDTWSKELTEGLKKGFEESLISADITTEYLNCRFWRVAGEEEIMRRICERARNRETDLIVTSGDEALYTLLTCGDSLPSKIPVVFMGVEFPNYKIMRGYKNIAGTIRPHSFDMLLKMMKDIFPERKDIILLSEETTLGRWGRQAFKEEWRSFISENGGYQLKEFDVTIDPFMDIVYETQISKSAERSIVVIPYWGLYMPSITKSSKAPTFAVNGSALTKGGFCVAAPDAYKEACQAGNTASRILKGASPASFKIEETKSQLTFDHKQLLFFHVKKDKIPKEGIIINESYMEKYGIWFAMFYMLVIGLLIYMIAKLIVRNRRSARNQMRNEIKILTQNRLVAQRNEFEHILHSIYNAVVTLDMSMNIQYINRSMLQMLGVLDGIGDQNNSLYEGQVCTGIFAFMYKGENIIPTLLEEVSRKNDHVKIPESTFLQDLYAKVYLPISGEVAPLHVKGKQYGYVLNFRNISDEALRNYFYDLAITENSIYPWQYNSDNDSFFFPEGYMKKMGHENKTAISRDEIYANVHPQDISETIRLFSLVIDSNAPNVRLSFRQRNASGKYEWWEFRAKSVNEPIEKNHYPVVGVCQNIQYYKSIEMKLTEVRDYVLQVDKVKTSFLANTSHEIRTPLNAIVGFSDLLKNIKSLSEEEIKLFVETINKNCVILLASINNILELSRMESEAIDFQFSSCSVPVIIQEIYDLQYAHMRPGVTLVKQIPEGNEKNITTDFVRLKQVLNSLITNATKYTISGSITIGYKNDEPDYTIFFVEDTGVHFSEEEQDHTLARFYKTNNLTQTAGLELSISQIIVARLRGTMHITLQEGVGSRVTVRIPNDNNK